MLRSGHRIPCVGLTVALILCGCLAVPIPAGAQAPGTITTVSVTNRAGLGANDFIDWGSALPYNGFSPVSTPDTITTNNGFSVTIDTPSHGAIYGDPQSIAAGNFAPEDNLLYNGPLFGSPAQPVSLTFAKPVSAVGAQIQECCYTPFTGTLIAYDISNNIIGSVTLPGISTSAADNSALFLGLASTNGADIAKVSFDTTVGNAGGVPDHNFYVNRVDIAENTAPIAANQSITATQDTLLPITLSATDTDGDKLTYSETKPAHGSLTGTAPGLTYTPATGYVGADSFTFKANDGALDSNTATISITIIPKPPIANPQSVSLHHDTSQALTLVATDTNGDRLTYMVMINPTHGSLIQTGTTPSITYSPAKGYVGTDSFTFEANDGAVPSNIAPVTLTVTDTPPVASTQSVTATQDTPLPITLSATDADGDKLTYSVVSQPAHGALTGTAPSLTYTPALGFSGSDSFTFKANDGALDSNMSTVSIIVTPSPNSAPVCKNQSVTTPENMPFAIALVCTDANGDPLTYTVVISMTHGTLSGTLPSLTYTPTSGYSGGDSFTFKANDGKVDSNLATVSITVTPAASGCSASDGCVTIPTTFASPGRIAQVLVTADKNVANLAGIQFTLQYDPTFLSISNSDITIQGSGFLLGSDKNFTAVNTQPTGTVTIGITGTTPVSGAGTIAQLNFHVSPNAPQGAVLPIGLLKLVSTDALANLIDVGAEGGSILIGCSLGDLSGDGKVNIQDATEALRIAVGLFIPTTAQLKEGDFDGDGVINIVDVEDILRIAVGLDPKPSGCQ